MNFPGKTALFAALLAAGCQPEAEASVELALKVQRLSAERSDEVSTIRVTYTVEGQSPKVLEAALDDLDASEDKRRLALTSIPAETPVRVRVEGLDAADELVCVGVLGPLSLSGGERLRRTIVLAPARQSIALSKGAPPPRFLHTATHLLDGRVLITGGFAAPEPTTCPEGAEDDSLCFALTARDDVWLFEPSDLSFHPVGEGLLEPRAGHSATRLPDGRVLLAGGAKAALLVVESEARGAAFKLLPLDAEGAASAHASFEMFDPVARETAATREPARGRILGSADEPERPGPLSAPRFLHAAAANPVLGERVILAGGAGAERSSGSYEVFDARRSGGYGVVPNSLTPLNRPRSTPSAVALRAGQAGWVWLFGGNRARDDEELSERWSASRADAIGGTAPATESAFPQASGSDPGAHPEYGFPQAHALALARGSHALCAPNAAPSCDQAGRAWFPTTSLALDALPCSAANQLRLCFLVEAATGSTTPCALSEAHLLGATAELDDGRGALTGGFSDLALTPSPSIEFVALAPQAAGPTFDASLSLHAARALHTSTGLFDGGLLSLGGLSFRNGQLELVTPSAELLFF